MHRAASIPGCNHSSIFESQRSRLWGGPYSEPLRQNPLEKEGAPPAARCSAPRPPERPSHPAPRPFSPGWGRTARSQPQARGRQQHPQARGRGAAQRAPSARRRAAFKRPHRTAPDWRRRDGHTPGQGQRGEREARASLRGGEGNEGGRKPAPEGRGLQGSGRRPAPRCAGRELPLPDGPAPAQPPPPFLSSPPRVGRGGCILPRPTPRRAGPDVLPHPARPPATLLPGREARPPRCPPHSPTSWPRPCRRISPPARPGGLAAAAALGPPWPLPWWLPGWALSPSDGEERGGGPRLRTRGRCEDTSARGERSAAAASRPLTGRPLGSPRLTRRATVGASRSGAVAARSLRPLGAACSSRLSARLGASRCCRRLRLRARKATRGRSRGDCRGGEGGAAPSRSISR